MIYLAGPYSHENDTIRELRYKILTKITAVMVKEGHIVFSPITNGVALSQEVEMPFHFEFWEDYCIEFLINCSKLHIVTLSGWKESRGIKAEIKYFEETWNDVPNYAQIKYIDPLETKWGVLSLVLHHNLLLKKEQKWQ